MHRENGASAKSAGYYSSHAVARTLFYRVRCAVRVLKVEPGNPHVHALPFLAQADFLQRLVGNRASLVDVHHLQMERDVLDPVVRGETE